MITRRTKGSILFTLSTLLTVSQIACGQAAVSPVRKDRAMKEVHVLSLPGWQEAMSGDGRFRILFPSEPQLADNVASLKGFKLVEPERNWFAYYTDFDRPRAGDETSLRSAYRGSVEAIINKNGTRLLTQKDVFLNERLGTEFVIEAPGTVSYMRAFLFDRRMYTLAVDLKRAANGDATIPNDVQRFFESFTYWDVS